MVLSADPFLSNFFAVLKFILTASKTDKEITLSGGGGPFALTAGHLNSDSQIDIAVANSRSSNFSVVIRTTNESFHYPTRDYVVGGGTPLAITSGDYNNDNMTDIAVASNAKNTIEIYLQRKIFK